MQQYEGLVREHVNDIAFRLESLEVPLRLGATGLAQREARSLESKTGQYTDYGVWVAPLATFLASDKSATDEDQFEAAANRKQSRYMKAYAQYWVGLKRLSQGNRQGAIESSCSAWPMVRSTIASTISFGYLSAGKTEGSKLAESVTEQPIW